MSFVCQVDVCVCCTSMCVGGCEEPVVGQNTFDYMLFTAADWITVMWETFATGSIIYTNHNTFMKNNF